MESGKRFFLEYAQYRNGRFVTFQCGGEFDTREEAESCARAHGIDPRDSDDCVISDTWAK